MLILLLTLYDLLFYIELSLTITLSASLLSVEQTCDKFLFTRITFDLLSSKSKPVISESVACQSFLFLKGQHAN